MYLVYLFKEKESGKIIYVGSSSRPSARMKEHHHQLNGMKKPSNIHKYMNEKGYKFYKDVEVIWVDSAENREEMLKKEEEYFYKFIDSVKNERPAENMSGKYNPRRRKVKCLNNGKVFDTISECAKYYNKGRTTICRVLTKEVKYTYVNGEKYIFEFENGTCND